MNTLIDGLFGLVIFVGLPLRLAHLTAGSGNSETIAWTALAWLGCVLGWAGFLSYTRKQ